MNFNFQAIAIARSCYKQKFGIPRQSGLVEQAQANIEILAPFNRREAFEDLQHCTHIWLQFVFHQNHRQEWKTKVKAPRLGGNKTIGVFATRSPTRPNPIGLSVVKLESINFDKDDITLAVRGIDFVDGTPILDIKPYVPYCDLLPEAKNSFAEAAPEKLAVKFTEIAEQKIEQCPIDNFRSLVIDTLALNPAPPYHDRNSNREYKVRLFNTDVCWEFEQDKILVTDLAPC